MSHFNKRWVGGALLLASVATALVACGGSVSSVPTASNDAGGGAGGDGGGGGVTDGAIALDGARPPDGSPPDASVVVCKTDPDCNGDPQISSIEGYCYEGICICREGLHVQPNGKCSKTPAPQCTSSSGKCFQAPASCPVGFLEGSQDVSFTCGDLVAAVCCFVASACQGPEFSCCSPVGGTRAPICESGFRTCPPQYAPVAPGTGCK